MKLRKGQLRGRVMYKVYVIDFAPSSKDFPNNTVGNKFRLISSCSSAGDAWGIAKSEWVCNQKKTVIIDPNGVPIGGY